MKKLKIFPLIMSVCLIFAMLAPSAQALSDPNIGARAAIIVDLNTDQVLYGKDMNEQRAPASLTKIMTALLAIEAIEAGSITMDDIVTAQADCRTGLDETSSTSGITAGVTISVRELLYCTLLQSANEATNVLGSYISGSIEGFVAKMNHRAEELGCEGTHFMNTNGLPSEGHYSTAYDLYLITKEAIKHPVFLEICNTKSYKSENPAVNGGQPMENSNALINPGSIYSVKDYTYEYASGVKTGYTKDAGYCLISTAEKDGMRFLAVLLGCDGLANANIEEYRNFEDSINIYNWAFDNFEYKTVLKAADPIYKAPVENSKGDNMAILRPAEDVEFLLPRDTVPEDVTTSPTLYSDHLTAPIKAGTVLGKAEISIDGKVYGSVELVCSGDVELASGKLMLKNIAAFMTQGWVIALLVLILIVLITYGVLRHNYNKLRREHIKKRRLAEQRKAEEQRRQQEAEQLQNDGFTDEELGIGYDVSDDGEPERQEDPEGDHAQDEFRPEEYGLSPDQTEDPLKDVDWDDILR